MEGKLSVLGEEYSTIADHAVQRAFRRAYDEIEKEQESLRHLNPKNPLLDLVELHPNRQGCSFSKSFKPRVVEHLEVDLTDPRVKNYNVYYLIGAYVELLREEQKNPKFLPR